MVFGDDEFDRPRNPTAVSISDRRAARHGFTTMACFQGAGKKSIFIGRNPLKSPDSEKKMKGNENNFPFISFHFLCFCLHGFRLEVVFMP
jgi:hypothetical protein